MRINIKRFSKGLAFASAFLVTQVQAINIFACEPEYAALSEHIAGDKATIFSATSALQDPHYVQARPSLIAQMRRADLVICAGADLEVGWLPMLQMKANNRNVLDTKDGLLFASDHVQNLDIPTSVDRRMGDVHELGNPHVHLDPIRLLKVAKALTKKLQMLDETNSDFYQENWLQFSGQWQSATEQWKVKGAPLQGKEIIAYHSSFRYLFAFLGMLASCRFRTQTGAYHRPAATSIKY